MGSTTRAHTRMQAKTLPQLAGELGELQASAAANRLRPDQLAGGTFTLSNIGTIGGTYASPLVNPPEVGAGPAAARGWARGWVGGWAGG